MGKRYFCDYCDRSFQDNLHNRKKHLNGVQHLRAKKAWYDLFRGESGSSQDALRGEVCRKQCFLKSPGLLSPSRRTAPAGASPSLEAAGVRSWRAWPRELRDLGAPGWPGPRSGPGGGGAAWLPGGTRPALSGFPGARPSPSEKTVFQYPPGWPPIQDLPPSLQAPPPGGWLVPPNLQWG
uniref:Zinc finger matrin-type protein 5 n=1 Tax=Pelodiscus sinensis TaxID=13735 RepID=K7FBK2_PELSI